jgi:hypothetical protein
VKRADKPLPGQTGMLGVPGRQPDGRRGKVLSIRLTDVERETIAAAIKKKNADRRWYWERRGALGPFIVATAVAEAEKILGGTPSTSPKRSR